MQTGTDYEIEWFHASVDRQHVDRVDGNYYIPPHQVEEYKNVAKCVSNLSGWNAENPPTRYASSLIQALKYEIGRQEYLAGRDIRIELYRVIGTELDFKRGVDGILTITDKDGGPFDFWIDVSLRTKQYARARKVISRKEAAKIVAFSRNPRANPAPRLITQIRREFATWFHNRVTNAVNENRIIVLKNPPQNP